MKQPRKQFNQDFSEELQQELLRLPYRCYESSQTEVDEGGYEDTIIPEISRPIRRHRMDTLLYQLKYRFSNVITRFQLNIAHNCHHAVVISGNTILTASFIHESDDFPPDSLFREFYAGNNEILQYQTKFDFKPEDNIFKILEYLAVPDERNYAVLVHGLALNSFKPGFVKVIFPDSRLTSLLDDSIDLRVKYPLVVQEMLVGTNEIKDNVTENISVKLNKEKKGLL
jgi:hypothetical protein